MTIRRKVIGISKTRDMRGLEDYYENAYEDRYSKDKDRNKYKKRYRDDSYDLGRSRSKEKPCAYGERKVSNRSKLELIYNIISQLHLNNDITSRFIEAVYANVDDLFDNACSVAEVDH